RAVYVRGAVRGHFRRLSLVGPECSTDHRLVGARNGRGAFALPDDLHPGVGMKLYRIMRGLHLYTSFVLMVFVLMYFVSGYVILHGKWFGAHPPAKSVREAKIATPVSSDPQELQSDLQNQLGLHGK